MSGHCKGCGVYHEEDDDRLCGRCQDNKRAHRCVRCGSLFPFGANAELCFECMVRKWDAMYTRPEKIPHGWCFVSVSEVRASSGVREHETRWATMSEADVDLDTIAKDAALDWYNETDQSSDAEVFFRVERYDGATHAYHIRLEHQLVAEILQSAGGAA